MSDPDDIFLRISQVSKLFGDFRALDSVSLDIRRGEFICFLGPSGCGKTTLLRAISGLDPQTSGTIHQNGKDISALPPSQRDFGIVFQSYALFPNLSVRDNVAYGLRSRRLPRSQIAARVDDLLTMVGLAEQARKFPAQLSGGQQQRVALARALAPEPQLLLLDEPLSALDARVRTRLRGEIRQLQRRLGVTTVMVTHDQEEALTMADRVVVMNRGRIEQIDTPYAVYATPASLFVADFIGKINTLDVSIRAPGIADLGSTTLTFLPNGASEPAPGERAVLCLRPEDIVLQADSGGGANCLAATVRHVEFLGNHAMAALDAPGLAGPLMVQLSLHDIRRLSIREGASIEAHVPSDRFHLFQSGPAAVPVPAGKA